VAAEKSQLLPLWIKLPALELVAAVTALQAVAAEDEAVKVSVVTPPTIDGAMVMLVPAT